MIPGEIFTAVGDVTLNADRPTVTLAVANTGDRPIQVGSHYHFYETNIALKFDRDKARGWRLDIPAGTAVRFEPGEAKRVTLVEFGGTGEIFGLNSLTSRSNRSSGSRVVPSCPVWAFDTSGLVPVSSSKAQLLPVPWNPTRPIFM